MRVSPKGQVTFPLAMREKAGIAPGTDVEFIHEGKRLYIRKIAEGGRGPDLLRRMSGKGSVKMTTTEIMALTRGEE